MKIHRTLFVFATATVLTASAIAADGPNIKPGLWEIQNQTQVNGQQMPDMQKMMANLPPEAQARMKDAMAKNGGLGMGSKGMTVCMTPDQIARGDVGNPSGNNHCKLVDMTHSGNQTTIKMHCDSPQEADMTTEMTHVSDSEWHSASHMTSGQHVMDSTSSGKWLKADCGDVKPLSDYKPKNP
jgi:hypothetical protein